MKKLVTTQQMRQADTQAIERYRIPSRVLMERAALAVADRISSAHMPCEAAVLCGPGNNGGDGFAIARILWERGFTVRILAFAKNYTGSAGENRDTLERLGLSVERVDTEEAFRSTVSGYMPRVTVDALFGTGLNRPPEGTCLAAIRWVNGGSSRVFAVDIPSGVNGDSGKTAGEAVRADETVTFQFAKPGLFLYPGRELAGRVTTAPIGIPEIGMEDTAILAEDQDIACLFPPRKAQSHKGDYGKLLVMGGSMGMAGAAAMCGESALRTGAGLVTAAMPACICAQPDKRKRPEIMTLPAADTADGCFAQEAAETLLAALAGKTAAAIGPGMGRSGETGALLKHILPKLTIPFVLDADGLYHLAGMGKVTLSGAVLTPHAAEAARLMGCSVQEAADHPVETAQALAAKYDAVVLVKGSTTVVAAPDGRLALVTGGCPGMATAGSGDVLTGIIAALLAKETEPFRAAWTGAQLHGLAGRLASERLGEAGMLAGDMIDTVPHAIMKAEE